MSAEPNERDAVGKARMALVDLIGSVERLTETAQAAETRWKSYETIVALWIARGRMLGGDTADQMLDALDWLKSADAASSVEGHPFDPTIVEQVAGLLRGGDEPARWNPVVITGGAAPCDTPFDETPADGDRL